MKHAQPRPEDQVRHRATNRRNRRGALPLVLALLVGALAPIALGAAPAQARVPGLPHRYTAKIEGLAAYVGQSTCSPSPKAGTAAFAAMLLRTYPSSRSLGISRACGSGGQSEHKEGRAFDWGVSVHSARDRASVKALFAWLFKTDRYGNRYAMARRLGIMYVIWNHRIWGAYSANQGWRRYTGSNPHTDHVHFSLSWAGARKQSSFWKPRSFVDGGTPPTPPRPSEPTDPTPQPTRPTPTPHPTGDDHSRARPAKPEPKAPAALAQASPILSERFDVPTDARSGGRPTHALVAGHRYLVEAWGTFRYSAKAGAVADAECSKVAGSWSRDHSLRSDDPWADHLDLYIDGNDLYSEADNGQSCDSGSHLYRWVYTAQRSGRAPMAVWDPDSYADNAGSLHVRLTDLDRAVTSASWSLPSSAPAGATGPTMRGGTTYDVTVSGTWRDGTGLVADAECTGAGGSWQRDRYDDGSFDVMVADLGDRLVPNVDGVRMEPQTDTGDRCDATDHRYTYQWTPSHDQPLSLRVDDPNGRSGDRGSLEVTLQPHTDTPAPTGGTPTPTPTTEPLQTEQLTVDPRVGTPQKTAQVFPAGTGVRVTVTGWYVLKTDSTSWVAGDAECTIASDDKVWRSTRLTGTWNGATHPLGDVAVDNRIITWRPSDGWGDCDETNHTYTYDYTVPQDEHLSFVVVDDSRDDDSRTLTVTVAPR